MLNVDENVKLSRLIHALTRELNLSPEGVGQLANVLYRLTQKPAPRWSFVMLNPEQMRFVIRATKAAKRPDRTLRVWDVALTYMKRNTGEITASYQQLAEDASTTVEEVSRAMNELTRIGALLRERQGNRITYFVNPSVGWNGGEGARREAARNAPKLQVS